MGKQRTWSAFGSIRRLPSEYEVVTHCTDWTTRPGAAAPLEVNPDSPENLWLRTYREGSPLHVADWTRFRDPDEMTYRKYVTTQDDSETAIEGILVEFEDGEVWDRPWADVLLRFFTPLRFLAHGLQMAEIYLTQMAPHSYVKNCAAFASADLLRLNTWVSYRTEMLRRLLPDVGFAQREREIWQNDQAWQGVREAIERLLLVYDFGESFVATNLVLAPALCELLLGIFSEIARGLNDDLTWLLLGKLMDDAERRSRWSAAAVLYAIKERDENAPVVADWVGEWGQWADRAVSDIAGQFTRLDPKSPSADDLLARAREVRLRLLPDVVTSRLGAGVG